MNGLGNLRRKQEDEREEWQLTLADMMTLILCFFVLMVAISSIDRERYKVIADSLGKAMGSKSKVERQKQKNLQEIKQEIETIIGTETSAVQLELRSNSVAISLKDTLFFNIGSADLTEKAFFMLNRITETLLDIPYMITVEGHADNIPIKSAQFPSNWELSAARACAVARFLIDRGFPKNKIQILGLADTRPLFPNVDGYGRPIPENQARNRRVVILVTN